jgi:hypothetical protein
MTKLVLLAAIFACAAAAQPPVIRVIRNGSASAYVEGKATTNVIGLSAISGPLETWLLELHDSFGSLEDLDKAIGGVTGANSAPAPPRAFIGRLLLTGLSYRPEQWIQDLPKTRYLAVAIYRTPAEGYADFAKFFKSRRALANSVNLDRPALTYQVVSGEPAGTYIVITALPSLRVLDEAKPATPAYAEGDQAAARKAAADIENASEHSLFRVDPRMSYVSEDFAAGDTNFWRPGN